MNNSCRSTLGSGRSSGSDENDGNGIFLFVGVIDQIVRLPEEDRTAGALERRLAAMLKTMQQK